MNADKHDAGHIEMAAAVDDIQTTRAKDLTLKAVLATENEHALAASCGSSTSFRLWPTISMPGVASFGRMKRPTKGISTGL